MNRILGTVLACVLGGLTWTAQAHHSWSAVYDNSQSITVQGVVAEFLRRRPHSALSLNVENPDGETVLWTVEWGRGFRDAEGREYDAEELRPGDAITVTGQPARASDNSVRLESVVRESDGLTLQRSRGRRGRDRNRDRS